MCVNGHIRTPESVTLKRECKQCLPDIQRKWSQENKIESLSIKRRYRLKKKFNLTNEWFDDKLKFQGNKCAICSREFTWEDKNHTPHVDHNHETNKVRGILCDWCNKGLGNFEDSLDRLKAAIDYLAREG